jgi:hypothetical protein
VTIEVWCVAEGYGIFHNVAVGNWLVWETSFCMHTLISICDLIAIENWPVNQCLFTVTTCFETKSFVETLRCFWHEFHVLGHGRIPLLNTVRKRVDYFNIHGIVVYVLNISRIFFKYGHFSYDGVNDQDMFTKQRFIAYCSNFILPPEAASCLTVPDI